MLITKTDTHNHAKETKLMTNKYKNPSHPRSPESGEIGARGVHRYDLEDQPASHIQTSIAFKKLPSTALLATCEHQQNSKDGPPQGNKKNDMTFKGPVRTSYVRLLLLLLLLLLQLLLLLLLVLHNAPNMFLGNA